MNSDKDNNSAVISLGEMCSDNAAQHPSSTGSPPPPPPLPPTNSMSGDEALPHRTSVNRCGSPPTGRSVSFLCGHDHRNEMDMNGSARLFSRRQSGEQKETSVELTTVVSSTGTQCHIEDKQSSKLESIHTDSTPSPSGIRVCRCVNSQASKLSDVEGCQALSGHDVCDNRPATDVRVDEDSPSSVHIKQTAAPECCVIHVSSSS